MSPSHPDLPDLVDSHCHLDFPDLAPDRAAIIARAEAAGVNRMVTICTRLKNEPLVRRDAPEARRRRTPCNR
jgi:TatD DNase family protein